MEKTREYSLVFSLFSVMVSAPSKGSFQGFNLCAIVELSTIWVMQIFDYNIFKGW